MPARERESVGYTLIREKIKVSEYGQEDGGRLII
jgi:hypothetical protein